MRRLYYLLILLLAVSCMNEPPYRPEEPALVVEGWIENDRSPVVFVSTAYSLSDSHGSPDELIEHILRYATVTIEHNGEVFPLTANVSDYYFMKNYFTTSRLIGEVGETYTLRVEWNGRVATATTTIPEPAEIDSFEVSLNKAGDGYRIKAVFQDNPQTRDFYKFSVWVENSDKYYTTAYLGKLEDAMIDFKSDDVHIVEFYVERGYHLPNMNLDGYYQSGDVVKIKFSTMNEESYRFWSQYDQNSLMSLMPLSLAVPNCEGNIDGALGYWDGYGINEYKVCVD